MSDNSQLGKIGWIDTPVGDAGATAALYQP